MFINELPHYLDNVLRSLQVTLNPVKLNDGNCLIEEIIFHYVAIKNMIFWIFSVCAPKLCGWILFVLPGAHVFYTMIVPTPTLVGRRNYILNWVFFVQSILADRYIHRRELWVVSLNSPSSVEYGIKKIFSIFVFYRVLSRFKVL